MDLVRDPGAQGLALVSLLNAAFMRAGHERILQIVLSPDARKLVRAYQRYEDEGWQPNMEDWKTFRGLPLADDPSQVDPIHLVLKD